MNNGLLCLDGLEGQSNSYPVGGGRTPVSVQLHGCNPLWSTGSGMPRHSNVSQIFDRDAELTKTAARVASLCRMVSARYLNAYIHDGDVRRHDQPSACCFA